MNMLYKGISLSSGNTVENGGPPTTMKVSMVGTFPFECLKGGDRSCRSSTQQVFLPGILVVGFLQAQPLNGAVQRAHCPLNSPITFRSLRMTFREAPPVLSFDVVEGTSRRRGFLRRQIHGKPRCNLSPLLDSTGTRC